MCGLCCLLTLIVPLAILLPLALAELNESSASNLYISIGVLVGAGVFYCCCISSFRTVVTEGGLCRPAAPDRTSSWTSPPARVMAPKTISVIFNPHAGVTKSGVSKLDVCRQIWEAAGITVTAIKTTHAGHCRELARDMNLTGVDALCAIGGDGTLHELVNGALARSDGADGITFGFLPGGSGNSIMCDFGTWELHVAAQRIADGAVQKMDAILVTTGGETICSINEVACGLVGDIGTLAEDYRWMGPKRYENVAAFKLLCGYSQHTVVEWKDETGSAQRVDDNFLTVFINQTQHYAKGLRAAPYARVDDGLMNLTFVMATGNTRGDLLAGLNQMPDGRHHENPKMKPALASECTLTFDSPGVFNIDGEIIRHDGKISMSVIKQKLSVFADDAAIAGNMI